MARPLRIQFPGAIYHVALRGNERRPLFRDDADCERFLTNLARTAETYSVRLYLYCLMGNHVHLLLETRLANLDRFMGSLQGGYAIYFNLRHRRSGHLTQGRYKAWLVESDEYLLRLSRYIHLNPAWVKAVRNQGIVQRRDVLRRYRWSSYEGYVNRDKRKEFIDYEPILAQVGGRRQGRERGYRRYVEDGLARSDRELAEVKAESRLAVGSPEFVERIEALYEAQCAGLAMREDVAFRRALKPLPVTEVLRVVGRVCGVTDEQLRQRRRNAPERAVAALALQRFCGMTQRAIGRELQIGSGVVVSQQIRRWEARNDSTMRRQSTEVIRRLTETRKF